MKFLKTASLTASLTEEGIIPAVSIAIGLNGSLVFHQSSGVNHKTGRMITDASQFDIASLTKILTCICFMKLIEAGKTSLDEPVCKLFPEMDTVKPIVRNGEVIGECSAGEITWHHALTHTSGYDWTGPKTRPSLIGLDKGLDVIFRLPLAYRPGEHVVYSDIPIILMGKAIEALTGEPLDIAVSSMVCGPLALTNTGYRRRSAVDSDRTNVLPTEFDDIFRGERVWGAVHDENAYLMDGVAGHAGIFSTALDMCILAMAFQSCLESDGLLKAETARMMIQEHAEEDGDRRGILWQLSGRGPGAYTRQLSPAAYGHTGFTGCFLWNDPVLRLSVVLLSNDVYHGRKNRQLNAYRADIIQAVLSDIHDV